MLRSGAGKSTVALHKLRKQDTHTHTLSLSLSLSLSLFVHLHLHVFLDLFDVFSISLNVSLISWNLFVHLSVGFHCYFGFILQISNVFGLFSFDIQVQIMFVSFFFSPSCNFESSQCFCANERRICSEGFVSHVFEVLIEEHIAYISYLCSISH